MKYNSKWHQVGLLFFNYYNDARCNKHKILSSISVRASQSWVCILLWFTFPYISWDIDCEFLFLYFHGDLWFCGFMFDFKILYKLKILSTGRFRVNMIVSPENVSDDTQVIITQKILKSVYLTTSLSSERSTCPYLADRVVLVRLNILKMKRNLLSLYKESVRTAL